MLATAGQRRPRQANLRRAISTAYYALFHALAKDAADLLVGTKPGQARKAWAQTYRALEHGFAKNACNEAKNLGFHSGLTACAATFVPLQETRHKADYDPDIRFTRAEALEWVDRAEAAIKELRGSPRDDRRAFAIQLLLKKRP
jgi:uncharacterized protein (UPF0332 family)